MRVRFTLALTPALSPGERGNRPPVSGEVARALVRVGLWGEDRKAGESKVDHRICENTLRMLSRVQFLEVSASHEPSFGARPVPGRSGSDSLLVPEPSPSRRLHSDPLRAGTSRAPDAAGFRGARRDKSSERSLLGERAGVGAFNHSGQNTPHPHEADSEHSRKVASDFCAT